MLKKHKYIVIMILVLIVITTAITVTKLNKNKIKVGNCKRSPEIILYNTHPCENYSYGKDIITVTNQLKEKLSKEGFKSVYLNVPKDAPRIKGYQTSRNLILKNVNDYNKKILLDIHRDISGLGVNNEDNGILIIIGKKNPNYEQNKEYANLLLKELKKSDNIKASIGIKEQGRYNQDLSSKSLLIEIGDLNSSEKDVQRYIDKLALAIKNIN